MKKIAFLLRFVFVSILIFAINGVGTGASSKSREKQYSADIVIYGGTSAGIIAAVEAVHSGKSVLVVSPDIHLGGLSSGGLGFTDTGK
jgi:ribulose 1,5-bisphosphate synthetase/thiazole synthase